MVIASIGVLAALLLPVLSASKHKAQQTVCTSNLRQINLGVRMYSDDARDASPSVGWSGAALTNVAPYAAYKALMKNYVGLNGQSSPRDKLFACPADTFYPTCVFPDATPPFHFMHKSLHDDPILDFSSYAFNGGDNASHKLGTNSLQVTGMTGIRLSSVKKTARTVLLLEASGLAPWSWHDPSSHGVARDDGAYYNDAKNIVSFVDGHVRYIKMFWNPGRPPGHGPAWLYDPPPSYDYQWSPD